MRRFCPFLIPLCCLVLLMGCKLTIESFSAPDTANTGSVISLTVSGTATNTGDGATEHGVVVQIPAGWRVLYAKANVGGIISELTEDSGIAALYSPESGHVIWAGKSDYIPPLFSNSGNVSVTIKVLTTDFSESIGQIQIVDLKAVVCVKIGEVWNTEDPKDVYDFAEVSGEKYQQSITVTQSGEDTTAPDPIVNAVAEIAVGTRAVQISWSGYNEDAQGDVVTYHVYRSTNSFSDVSGMNPIAEVSVGHTSYFDDTIEPGNEYYYGLTAIDEVGNENHAVSTAYVFVYVPGSIAGTLYGTDGSMRLTGQNIEVYAYTGSCDNPVWAGTANIDSSTADYSITGLQPGTYFLSAESNGNYFSEWWATGRSVRDCVSAQEIVLNEGQAVSGKDFQLEQGATISGTVYYSISGMPVIGKYVQVNAYTGSPCGGYSWVDGANIDTTTGTYTINGLQPGTYYLQTWSNENYLSEWWASGQSVRDCGGAQEIVLNEGQAVSGKDFQLEQGATISGTVYDSISGMPVIGKNIQVAAITGSPCGGYFSVGSAIINTTTGNYMINGLQPGTYYLQTWPNENYLSEWWASGQSVRDCGGAQEITLNEGQAVSGKDFQLEQGATISGTVYDSISGMPVIGKNIQVAAITGSPCGGYFSVGSAIINTTTGNYMINGLQPGTYYLQTWSNENYLSEWWASGQSVRDCGGAQEITLTVGQAVSGKDFQLEQGATISGTVYDSISGMPVIGKYVEVVAITGSPCGSYSEVGGANIDTTTGTYTISGLPSGTYYLRTWSNENYLREWWASGQSVRDCGGAQEITLNEGQAVSGKDFQLDPGATISGTVYDSISGMPVIGKYVQVRAITGSPCGIYFVVVGANIDTTSGTYTINGLQPGTYFLQTRSSENYFSEWWASGQSVRDCGGAQEITLNEGQAVSGKDFQLDPGATISGTVYDSINGMPVIGKNIQVSAIAGSPCGGYSWVGYANIDTTTGTYTINGLQPGSYYLQTWSSENYLSEWWASGQSSWDCSSAQEIVLTERQAISGKDFQLGPGATISGIVYQADGVTPINGEGIYIIAIIESPCNSDYLFKYISYTVADILSGVYTITGLPPTTYYLVAYSETGNFINEWWSSPVSTWRCSEAQGILISGAENINGKDFLLNRSDSIQKGDVNGDGSVGLTDLIETLQILTGKNIEVMPGTDVNQNGKAGMEEAIYILQKISGVRP